MMYVMVKKYAKQKKRWRPDLSSYEGLAQEILTEILKNESVNAMCLTDVPKIAMEKWYSRIRDNKPLPTGLERTRFETFPF